MHYNRLTPHARQRVRERTQLTPEMVEVAVRDEVTPYLGINPKDSSTDLLVLYDLFADAYHFLIFEPVSKTVITLIPTVSDRRGYVHEPIPEKILHKAKWQMEVFHAIQQQ